VRRFGATALTFQERCFLDDLIETARTDELWVKRKPSVTAGADPLI
jgi:hypothetical protein